MSKEDMEFAKLLEIHKKNLGILELQKARFGNLNVPLPVLNQIEDEENTIKGLENIRKREKETTEELKKTKDQVIHSERLSLIGELAANVAHEVKNPLVIISMSAKELLEEFSKDTSAFEDINMIERQARKAMRIIEGLLTFARKDVLEIRSVDVNDTVDKSLILVEGQMRNSNIKLDRNLEPSLPCIQADSRQLEQVFLNIILNAIQSMPDGGKLTISTSKNKKSVQITFTDIGCGIPEEHIENIFKPFFTTKGEGSTGLGLSISYGIIKSHDGDITVNSKVGKGTTFTITLPIERRQKNGNKGENFNS